MLTVGGCSSPTSPVGRSKFADSLRSAKPAAAVKAENTNNADNGNSQTLSAGLSAKGKLPADVEGSVSSDSITDGDSKGTHLELWTYKAEHVDCYRKLLKQWNDEDPDYTLEITFSTMPYEELHDKLMASIQKGEDGPDICDIDAFSFGEVSEGLDSSLYPLDVAMAPYVAELHPARVGVYKGSDNKCYGAPFRMGAAVEYWNMEALEQAGITQKEVDAVTTWDDYIAIGEKFIKSSEAGGRSFTAIDQDEALWSMLAVAEFSEETENTSNAASEMAALRQRMFDTQIAKSSDNITDDIISGDIVSFTESLAFTDTFISDIHDQYGKWYITKCPVFKEGQPCSVCLDDSVSIVMASGKAAPLAADFLCYAKLYEDNVRSVIRNDLSYDVCNRILWEDQEFAHDVTIESNTFFRSYPLDVLKEIDERIATVKP